MGARNTFRRKRINAYKPKDYRSPLSTASLLPVYFKLEGKDSYVRYVSGI